MDTIRLQALKDRLTAVAPDSRFQVDWFLSGEFTDADVDRLLAEATLEDRPRARLIKGRTSECHANSLLLVCKHRGWKMVTGLALSGGCWRVHSWCLNTRGRIIETTEFRDIYFGVTKDQTELRAMLESIVKGRSCPST